MWHILCDLCGWERIFDRSFIGVGRVEAQRLTRTFSTTLSDTEMDSLDKATFASEDWDATHDRIGFSVRPGVHRRVVAAGHSVLPLQGFQSQRITG